MRRRRGQVPAARRARPRPRATRLAAVLPARDALGVLRAHGVHRRAVGDAESGVRGGGDRVPLLGVLDSRPSSGSSASASSRYKIGSGEVTNLELVRARRRDRQARAADVGDVLVGRARRCRRGRRRPGDGAPVHVAVPDAAGAGRPERARASCASATGSRSASPTTRSATTRRSPPSRSARPSSRSTSRSRAICTAPTHASRPSRTSSRTSSTASARSRRCSRARSTRTTSSRSRR